MADQRVASWVAKHRETNFQAQQAQADCDKCEGGGWICDECGAPTNGGRCSTEGCAGDFASSHGCECGRANV